MATYIFEDQDNNLALVEIPDLRLIRNSFRRLVEHANCVYDVDNQVWIKYRWDPKYKTGVEVRYLKLLLRRELPKATEIREDVNGVSTLVGFTSTNGFYVNYVKPKESPDLTPTLRIRLILDPCYSIEDNIALIQAVQGYFKMSVVPCL